MMTSFGEGLGFELRRRGITVTVANPGGTATEFMDVAGMTATRLAEMGMMTSEKVARIMLRALARGRRSFVVGAKFKVMIWCARHLLPLGLRLRAAALFQKMVGGRS
jgi:short-subunit dehydrogenase